MIRVKTETTADVLRWMESCSAALWPAILGSLSFRRSRCIHANCPACLSGEQHPSHVLYGRHNGRQGAGSRQTATYRELIGIAEEVVANAKTALEKTARMRGKDLFAAMTIDALRDEIAHYCGLGARVIDQARRRVLDGEQVPNAEKIYSIFEPHTDLIKRGKVRTPVEFGHKVFLAESAKGLITQYEVLKGN